MLDIFNYFTDKIEHPILFFDKVGTLIYINVAAKKLFRLNKSHLGKINIRYILSAKYFSMKFNVLNELINKQTFVIQSVMQNQDSSENISVEIESFILKKDRKKFGRAVIVRDITIFQSLIDENYKKSQEYKFLNKLSNLVSSTLDLSEICKKVFDIVDSLFNIGGFFIATFHDKSKNYLQYLILSDEIEGKRIFEDCTDRIFPLSKIQKIKYLEQQETKVTFRTMKTILELSKRERPDVIFGDKERLSASIVTIPLRTSNEVIGLMSVQSYKFNAFSESDILFLETLAGHVANAINNANIFKAMNKEIDLLNSIHNLMLKIPDIQDENQLSKLICESIFNILSYNKFYFFISDKSGKIFKIVSALEKDESGHLLRLNVKNIPANKFAGYKRENIYPFTTKKKFYKLLNAFGIKINKNGICIFINSSTIAKGVIIFADENPDNIRDYNLFFNTIEQIILFSIMKINLSKKSETTMKNLNETQWQLIQSSKMSAIGTLASGIAHEFNNLLVGILSYSDFAININDTAKLKNALKIINSSAERAKSIANNLLLFARGSAVKKEFINPNKIIEDTISLIKCTLDKNKVKLIFSPGDLPEIYADQNQISQVCFNLILNSIYAIKKNGGEIRISTRGISSHKKCLLHPKDKICRKTRYGCVILEFNDNGVGISKEHADKIFEPFFTTKPSGEGTGLGLSVSYGIIKNHGGRILMDSREGIGTTFWICLPVPPKR